MLPPPRPDLVRLFERSHPGAALVPIVGDASARRFFRLSLPGGPSRVVMDYGAPFEGETDDVRLARVFEAASLRVARVHEAHPTPGCLVMEDLGDTMLEAVLLTGDDALGRSLHEKAVELTRAIAGRGTPALERSERAAGPTLDAARFRFEMDYFLEHYAAGFLRIGSIPASLREALHGLADLAASGPRVFCHRDFHSRNLMVVGGELAMVDIQDARWGPDTYDLASLLRDAYVDVDEAFVESVLGRLDGEVRARFEVVAAQRMLKALGTFGYQVGVLGRRRYAPAIGRTLARLRRVLPRGGSLEAVHRRLADAGLLATPSALEG
jgi:aminoglycoside/choline kinase family phosphotransferase